MKSSLCRDNNPNTLNGLRLACFPRLFSRCSRQFTRRSLYRYWLNCMLQRVYETAFTLLKSMMLNLSLDTRWWADLGQLSVEYNQEDIFSFFEQIPIVKLFPIAKMEELPLDLGLPLHHSNIIATMPVCIDNLQEELYLLFIVLFTATSLSTLVAYKVIRKFKKRRVLYPKETTVGSDFESDLSESRTPSPTEEGDVFEMKHLLNQAWKQSVVEMIHSKAIDKLQVDPSRSSLAAMVITSTDYEEVIDVIAIASAPRTNQRLQCLPRIALNDLRSLTLVRRCFLRTLYEDLHNMLTNGLNEGQILARKPDGCGFTRRSDLRILLFCNSICCDQMDREEKEKSVMPGRSGGMRSLVTPYSFTMMEKLCLWSVLGLQGSILSHVIEPIYVDAILVSSRTRAARLSSSLTRYFDMMQGVKDASQQPEGQSYFFPTIFGVACPRNSFSITFRRGSMGHLMSMNDRSFCTNWVSLLDSSEMVYSDTGATVNGKASRFCKANLFDSFANLSFARILAKMSWSTFQPVYPLSYAKVKSMAYPYQVSKTYALDKMKKDKRSSSYKSSNSSYNFHAFEPKWRLIPRVERKVVCTVKYKPILEQNEEHSDTLDYNCNNLTMKNIIEESHRRDFMRHPKVVEWVSFSDQSAVLFPRVFFRFCLGLPNFLKCQHRFHWFICTIWYQITYIYTRAATNLRE